MPLNLIYITNNPAVALIAEKNGVDRIMVDLEVLGKEERQKNRNTVISRHRIADILPLSHILTRSELLVRINPWNRDSAAEIEEIISSGAERIMLPMWKTFEEVDFFLNTVKARVHTCLLLETKEAVEIADEVLEHPLLDEIHIGLNDLHLSYGLTFMFELLTNGVVESVCGKCKKKGIPCGVGGIAGIGRGLLPAEQIIMEHYRLGVTGAILSRSFCNTGEIEDIAEIEKVFSENMLVLRSYEASLEHKTEDDYIRNSLAVKRRVAEIAETIKGSSTI